MSDNYPEYLSLAGLAEYSSISKSVLRKFIGAGMPHFRLGRSIRIKRSDFDSWLQQFRANGTFNDTRRRSILSDVMDEVRK